MELRESVDSRRESPSAEGLEVDVLRQTRLPERLVCQAARGDYYEGYVGDTDYRRLMSDVEPSEDDSTDSPSTEGEEVDGETTHEKTVNLIEKQLSRGHYGPFEGPQITFAVKGVPVFTERQLVRHRHLSFDVQSMRYADFSDTPYTTPETLTDSTLNRENGYTDLDEETKAECRALYESHMEEAFTRYEKLVDNGVPKEDARGLLGLGTEVNLTVSGNARSFLHLLDMRRKANAQWSIRQLSEMMLDELFEWMPVTFEYYDEHGPNRLSP